MKSFLRLFVFIVVFAISANVSFADYCVTETSGLSTEDLERGLLKELKSYSDVFIQAEEEYGVNAVFLSSVAALESGWGTSDVAINKNNIFGWTSNDGYLEFDSIEDCILEVAETISRNYLSDDGIYYRGDTVSAVNVNYNGSLHWEESVNSIMTDILYRVDN